jgi:two-component system chemotaxis response regulator CheB
VAKPAPRRRSAPQAPVPVRSRYDVVAIGASAGGLNALTATLRSLPHDFPGSIVIVQHLAPKHKSHLPELLARATRLHVKQAEHGEVILPGWIYVAPPDEHLLVGPGKLQLAHSQLVHFTRPSIDLLFESVAGTYGARSIGVILSGSGQDGASGIQAIKESGGTTIVQTRAEFNSMPEAALATNSVDHSLSADDIGPALMQLCSGNGIR